MSTIRDDIGWMVCHPWDCGDAPGDVAVLNTEKLKDKLERYVAKRESALRSEVEQLKRENAALRAKVDIAVEAIAILTMQSKRAALSPQEAAQAAKEGR